MGGLSTLGADLDEILLAIAVEEQHDVEHSGHEHTLPNAVNHCRLDCIAR